MSFLPDPSPAAFDLPTKTMLRDFFPPSTRCFCQEIRGRMSLLPPPLMCDTEPRKYDHPSISLPLEKGATHNIWINTTLLFLLLFSRAAGRLGVTCRVQKVAQSVTHKRRRKEVRRINGAADGNSLKDVISHSPGLGSLQQPLRSFVPSDRSN